MINFNGLLRSYARYKFDLSIITGVAMVSFNLPVVKVTVNGSNNSLTEGENTRTFKCYFI